MSTEFARAALRAHVATELGESITSPAVLAEVEIRLKLAKTSPEQAHANAIVIEAARMLVGGDCLGTPRCHGWGVGDHVPACPRYGCLPIKSKGVT